MDHPQPAQHEWQDLQAASHTEHLGTETQQLAAAIEADGYKITILAGAIYVDAVAGPDPDTGVADCVASWRIEQVA